MLPPADTARSESKPSTSSVSSASTVLYQVIHTCRSSIALLHLFMCAYIVRDRYTSDIKKVLMISSNVDVKKKALFTYLPEMFNIAGVLCA